MPGLGTIIDAAGICAGGTIGLLCSKLIHADLRRSLLSATGVITLFMGIAGAMEGMLHLQGDKLVSGGVMMLLITFALGTVLGEMINIEGAVESFGKWLQKKSGSTTDTRFTTAFVTASMTVSIGAMAIVGAIDDGAHGDLSMLLFKTVFDGIVLIALSAALGKGCIFSVIPVVVIQGIITALARWAAPYITQQALTNLSLAGSVLIFCIGLNLLWNKKVRVLNMVPALLFTALWAYLPISL